MNKKLYVGNLAYSTTESNLRTLFAQAGEIVDVAVIMDRETGRSKGFGFVEMASVEAAQEAVKRFNGYSLDNRPIVVNEARPREERSGGGGGGGPRRDRDSMPRGDRGPGGGKPQRRF